jgi:transcription initiation factor IIF auxiliary subunit
MRKRIYFVSNIITAVAAGALISFLALPVAAQEISAANTSRYIGGGRWEWTVYINAPQQVLQDIQSVEYTLHPTFPDPVREVTGIGDPRFPFGLTTNGWGTFEIPIQVVMKDGSVRSLKHTLVFTAPPVEQALPITPADAANKLPNGMWSWNVFLQGPASALNRIQCVEYTLDPTFPNPVREVCKRGLLARSFSLNGTSWGPFPIRIRVFLKDGHVQEMAYELKF